MKTTITTPWGKAAAVEQVNVAQRAGERRFATVVELLETADGERLVRFAYTTGGSVRRGPVTLRAKDLERMQKLLERTPELREALEPMSCRRLSTYALGDASLRCHHARAQDDDSLGSGPRRGGRRSHCL